MFPFHEEKLKWDDYGETIRPDHYKIEEDAEEEAMEVTIWGDGCTVKIVLGLRLWLWLGLRVRVRNQVFR